jgi:hypothetical protein
MNIRIITTILLAATVAQADEMKLWRHLRTEMASSVTQGWLETRNDAANGNAGSPWMSLSRKTSASKLISQA